jgi:hypothetical protein
MILALNLNVMMKKLAMEESWLPKRMKAVRFSLRICVIRPEGTRNARANLLAESFRAVISRLRIRPGLIDFRPRLNKSKRRFEGEKTEVGRVLKYKRSDTI